MTSVRTQPSSATSAASLELRTGALGFPALLAQPIVLISPTMTAVLIIPLAFSNAGQGTWLAYLFGTAMLLFVVFNLNQFARRSTSPGSMYAYTGRGLGAVGGVLSGWTLIWSYLFIGVAGMTGFTIFSRQFLDIVGIHTAIPSFVFFAISSVVCWTLAVKDIRLSSVLTIILEGLSVLCILALAAIVLFKHGIAVDSAQVHLKGVTFRGMSLAVVACIFSLVGFESATALGGEARNPLQAIPRAVIWSLVLTGLFFVFMGYVEVFGTRGQHDTLDTLTTPLNTLADLNNAGYFKLPLSLGAMISFFALSLSCLNAGARIIYPMARHSVFPARLGTVHTSNATPGRGAQCVHPADVRGPGHLVHADRGAHRLQRRRHAGRVRIPAGLLHGVRGRPASPARTGRTQARQRGGGGTRCGVPAGPDSRQLLPAARLPGGPLPVHLPGLPGGGRRLAVHRLAQETRHPDRDRNRPGARLDSRGRCPHRVAVLAVP